MDSDPSSAPTPAHTDGSPGGAAPALSGAQRRYLRGIAARERPVVWIGEGGLSEGALRSVEEALEARELIKVRLRAPADKKRAARELSERSGAALCGLVGHTVILYRPRAELSEREIALPERGGRSG